MQQAYICAGVRTPIGRFGGALSSVRPDDLGAICIQNLLETVEGQVNPEAIGDVILGCANQAGEDNRNVARMSALLAGLPVSVPGLTVNRLCGSGLDAVAIASRAIQTGASDLVIAGGVESMSRAPLVMSKAYKAFSRQSEIHDTTIGWRFVNQIMADEYGVDPLPITAENLASEYNISRTDQDLFAYNSQVKFKNAKSAGFFKDEICPVKVDLGKQGFKTIVDDEHPRPETSLEKLEKLGTPFKSDGTVTAGNASGVNDGAGVLLLASDVMVKKSGLEPRARIIGFAVAGVPPRIMGIGPIPATQKALDSAGLRLADMDVIELNEAFAAQSLAVIRNWGLDDDDARINPNGGAIAIGHPLGMSGARLALTAVRALEKQAGRYGLITMCIGVGQGISMIIERV